MKDNPGTVDNAHTPFLAQLPAFALGCLDADERQQVAAHLQDCLICTRELQQYEQVVDLLPLATSELAPPLSAKNKLLARVTQSQEIPVTPKRPSLSSWLQQLLALPAWKPVAAFTILMLLITNLFLWQRQSQPLVPGTVILLSSPDGTSTSTGVLYISADGEYGTLIVEELRSLPADRQYQLWLIVDGERTNGGLFSVSDDGYASLEIESARHLNVFTSFGITIEPAGGSPAPTGPRVLANNW